MTLQPQRPGLLFIMVAPAGAGKNALMNLILSRTTGLRQLPTATTRAIRPGEQQGREHLYISHPEFQDMIDNDALLEWQEVHGQRYGIPRATIEDAINNGIDLIADIEYKGARYVRSLYPDNVVQIFIQPPSIGTLIKRMRARGDNENEIAKRLVRVPVELTYAPECDYLILNDDIDHAAEVLHGIILAEHSRLHVRTLRQERKPLLRYTYYATCPIIFEDEVLYRTEAPHFPTTIIETHEAPHEAALRLVNETLDIDPQFSQLLTGNATEQLVPPLSVKYDNGDVHEIVTMYFAYRVSERIYPPPGWSWIPRERAQQEQTELDILSTA